MYRNKGTIDLLHWIRKKHKKLPEEVTDPAHTAMMASVMANIHLIFFIPKMVLLGFTFFNKLLLYLNDDFNYFQFMNNLSNLTLVSLPITNLIVLLRYNIRIRTSCRNNMASCCRHVTWPIRRCMYERQKRKLLKEEEMENYEIMHMSEGQLFM